MKDQLPEIQYAEKMQVILLTVAASLWAMCAVCFFLTTGFFAFICGLVTFVGAAFLVVVAAMWFVSFVKVLSYVTSKRYEKGRVPYDWDESDKAVMKWFLEKSKKPEQSQ